LLVRPGFDIKLEIYYLDTKGEHMKRFVQGLAWLGMAVVLLASAMAWAGDDDWQKIGELTKGDRLPVNKEISSCKLVCVSGVAIINTLVVWQGSEKRGIPLACKLKEGESKEVAIGDKVNVTQIGMSLETKGKIEVYVK
jgi:hypothetical protein